jgi:hypothetical protein
MNIFYDGHYFIEEVAAARISNYLSHQNIQLTDEHREEIARVIMGAMASDLIGSGRYKEFIDCRKSKWGIE